ncbi:MAG: glycosyltransferase 87 family protein [Pseudonocardia sp.]
MTAGVRDRATRWRAALPGLLAEPPRMLLVALWALALVALALSLVVQYVDPVLPGEPWQSQGQLVDFRDSVWTPGGYLLAGGNPYDTGTYLADVPWTQGLALYAPAWLLVALPLAPLPFLVANGIYQLLGMTVVLLMIRFLLRWTLPRYLAIGTPVGLIWLVVWAAGRYALANVSTALVVFGVMLVLRGVWLRRSAVDPAGAGLATATTALGVALSLVKPQFGIIMVVIALAGRRWDAVWRGIAGLAAASTPILLACVAASGGVSGFLDGVRSNLARSTSAESAAGLTSRFNVSIDLVGQLARLGVDLPGPVRVLVPLTAMLLAAWIVVRSRSLLVFTVGLTTVVLLGFIHQFYDLLVLILPLCVGIGRIADGIPMDVADRARWLLASLPTVHVHRVSTNVIPGLTTTGADRVDTLVLLAALVLCLAATVRRPGDRLKEPSTGAAASADGVRAAARSD